MNQIKEREQSRLAFVIGRDGKDGAASFAQRVLSQYRKALSERNQKGRRCGYGQAYRRELVESCIVFRQFLRTHREGLT